MSHLASRSVIIVAGGIGLAPLRPVLDSLAQAKHPDVKLYIGARTAEDILFQEDIAYWQTLPGWNVQVTVDKFTPGWIGHVGVVTQLLKPGQSDPANAIVLTCGPEIMMRYVIQTCESLGIEDHQIYISMERNMQCGMGLCGHCQWGGYFICKEGPVFRFDLIRALFYRRDL